MVSKVDMPITTAVSRARAFIVASLSRTNKFTFTTAAVKDSDRDPCKNTSYKIRHGGSINSVLNYSIFLMPRFTGMRDGAGSAGFAGSGGGGAGLSLVMIASRW